MAGGTAGDERTDGHGGEHPACLHDRELPDVDEVEREDEDHRELAGGDGAGGEVSPGEGGEAEKAHVEKRGVGAAGLPPGEDGEEDDAEGDEYASGVFDETVDDRAGACGAEDEAEEVTGHVATGL